MTEQYQNEIALIRYHVWFPSPEDPYYQFNIPENTARYNFYGNNSVPKLYIDGSNAGSSHGSWEALFMARYNEPSDWMVFVDGNFNPGSRMTHMNIDVFLEGDNPEGDEFLRIALVENDIYWHAPNGTDYHNQTFRDLIPDAAGIWIDIEDNGVFEYSVDFEVNTDEVVTDNCEIVMFIQSTRAREILQGYKMPFTDLNITSVDNRGAAVPDRFTVIGNYPNPFNSSTNIRLYLPQMGNVQFKVYDIAGKNIHVSNLNLISGYNQIRWDGSNLASGVYFYNLTYGDNAVSGKMALVK